MNSDPAAQPAAGVVVAERYELAGRIAGGGMGEVWRAVDLVLGRTVAIKFLRAEFADDELFRERLRREARSAGSISHRGVVPVFDYGEIARDNAPYLAFIVMEHVDGPSLSAELSEQGSLGAERTLLIVEQTAAALQAAHDAGVVHRDIKPGNILVTPKGDVKITDFGIARAADSSPLTRTGTLTGTALYLSPEQASGQSASGSSDIYSLGVVAYACLTGRVPFTEGNDLTIALAHVQQTPPDLPAAVPERLRSLVMSMLAKDPGDRPASAGGIATIARRMIHAAGPAVEGHHPFEAPTTFDDTVPTQVFSTAAATPPPTTAETAFAQRPERQRRALRVGGVVLAAVLLGAGLLTVLTSGGTDVPAVVGKQRAVAEALLADSDLVPKVRTADAAGKKAGVVLAQNAAAGAEVEDGSTVMLTVASGNVAVPLAELQGATFERAAGILRGLGLGATGRNQVSTATPGTVIGVSPDDVVENGSTVDLFVAMAAEVRAERGKDRGDDDDEGKRRGKGKKGND